MQTCGNTIFKEEEPEEIKWFSKEEWYKTTEGMLAIGGTVFVILILLVLIGVLISKFNKRKSQRY